MDLLVFRKTSSIWIRIFSKRRVFWEPQKEILNEKFRPLWTEIGFFFLAKVSKYKASHWRIFFSIKLYKPFYKIISWNYELRKFWSIDFSSCFDFRYFPVSRESSCDASRCELTIRNLRSGAIKRHLALLAVNNLQRDSTPRYTHISSVNKANPENRWTTIWIFWISMAHIKAHFPTTRP